jgi:hypothetical protein
MVFSGLDLQAETVQLIGTLNEWKNALQVEGARLEDSNEVPLTRPYDQDDIERLFGHPLSVLRQTATENGGVPASSIFYLPDIAETEYIGGIDFELCSENDASLTNLTVEAVHEFLQSLQWTVSQYALRLITDVEKHFHVGGHVYATRVFGRTGCGDILQRFVALQAVEVEEDAKTEYEAVLKTIRGHFQVADTDRGHYWRGYDRWAFEAACAVGEIAETLFRKCDGVPGLADLIRESGPDLRTLEQRIADRPLRVSHS